MPPPTPTPTPLTPPSDATTAHFAELRRVWACEPRGPGRQPADVDEDEAELEAEDPSRFRLGRRSRFTEDTLNAYARGEVISTVAKPKPRDKKAPNGGAGLRKRLAAAVEAGLLSVGRGIGKLLCVRRSKSREHEDC